MPGQLVFPFGIEPALGHEDFILAPCNVQAFEFVRRWPDWPQGHAALYGPPGSGKTHLSAIWRSRTRARIFATGELTPEIAAGLEAGEACLIEDVDAVRPTEARDTALMALFERQAGALLLTGRSVPADWPVTIGDLKSRFESLIAFPLWVPDDSLLAALAVKHFADRQLDVADPVIRRIVTHVERTPEAVAAFVARADEKALAEKRAVTERLVLELLESEAHPKVKPV